RLCCRGPCPGVVNGSTTSRFGATSRSDGGTAGGKSLSKSSRYGKGTSMNASNTTADELNPSDVQVGSTWRRAVVSLVVVGMIVSGIWGFGYGFSAQQP